MQLVENIVFQSLKEYQNPFYCLQVSHQCISISAYVLEKEQSITFKRFLDYIY